jgi:transcriptional regulator of acetoin/glycerol metabolism
MNAMERLVIENPGGTLAGPELEEILAGGRAWSLAQVSRDGPSRGPDPVGDRDTLAAVLISERGNVSRAARRLGLPRSTLRYRLRLLGL